MIAKPHVRLAAAHVLEPAPVPGQAHRASLARIVDYALPAISDGHLRAIATVADQFKDLPAWKSPWHFHECELQIGLIVNGSLDLAYDPGRKSRAAKGDILCIPGKVLHDVGAASADYQIVEITFPGSFSTVECPPPPPGSGTLARTYSIPDAYFEAGGDGLLEYRYALDGPLAARYAIRRWVRDRNAVGDNRPRRHSDRCRITCVTQGSKTVETAGVPATRVGALDLTLMPPDTEWRDAGISDDYEAVEIAVL